MDVRDFPDFVLEAELERRKKLSKPELRSAPDFSEIVPLCISYIETVEKGETADSDLREYIFEAAMSACYGADVWNWIRNKMAGGKP